DWMSQGARVSQNLLYNNDKEDLFVEVNHGPLVIDNNIFLSPMAISNQSQGSAYIHNLIAGEISVRNEPNRFTPYFLPHSIEMAGLTSIYGGDDRFFNNIIVGKGTQMEELTGLTGYNDVRLPVWLKNNVFYFGARPSQKDGNSLTDADFDPKISLSEEDSKVILTFKLNSAFINYKVSPQSTTDLGKTKVSKAFFDNPDGSQNFFDRDYSGNKRSAVSPFAGPFNVVKEGTNSVYVW
ncbi:MAG: hypothetical protein HC905_15730, partial [Bacteroidales bacterium]|nr:hypothetical protein [Bacteroidales bacterium]